MARILQLDGTEVCKVIAFSRFGADATAQVAAEDEISLSALDGDVLFEDDASVRFKGRILSTGIFTGGRTVSTLVKALLYDH